MLIVLFFIKPKSQRIDIFLSVYFTVSPADMHHYSTVTSGDNRQPTLCHGNNLIFPS